MEVVNKRRSKISRNGVMSGSVWENRMKYDEVKGGIKVYSNSEKEEETPEVKNDEKTSTTTTIISTTSETNQVDKKLKMGSKSNLGVGGVMSGKRKTWKSESNFEGNPIQISRKRSELSKNLDEQCKELSTVSTEEMKKSSIQNKKSSVLLRKVKSEANNGGKEDENEKNSELRKVKSMSVNGNLRNSVQLVKAKSVTSKEVEEKCKNFEENKVVVVGVGVEESKKNLENQENCKEFGICEEKVITSNEENCKESQVKCSNKEKLNLENEENEEELDEVFDEEIEKELSVDVKEINVAENKPKKVVIEEKKLQISNEKSVPISPIIKKQSPPIPGQAKIHLQSPTRTKSVPTSDELHTIPRQHSKLQSFVDLVMWRDASKSALIFGIGTFVIISSSYTQDLSISFISVLSYLGLVYLAAIFLFRSLNIHRGANNINESSEYIVGEEEAMWILKLILPYINECLVKIRALFSGDPATTMKMAVLLFILARCGSSITIWKMSKLGFFGVFIVPKVCSSYSTQLTAYGTFWIRRFRDAWESCTHKKAVAFAIFTLVWNLSSIAARIWAVFMLYVGFRYYQQKLMKEGWVSEEETTKVEDYWQGKIGGQRQIGRRSTMVETRKQKKTI
ncbi:reticulon-like protein B21 [Nicotiana sylvestris]|uniref:Reticulon-like protein n=1 Tax=Nicotiana sylvestris TaxID=4096 RepID=A0A1U7UVR0_NICSY|nr:PREDICTED: reticulon-like protein B21 [Nicotiana sylvestris]